MVLYYFHKQSLSLICSVCNTYIISCVYLPVYGNLILNIVSLMGDYSYF